MIAVGLNMSAAFRTALGNALKGNNPAPTPFAIAEVSAGKPGAEVSASAYISDVTIGTGDGLVEVELVASSGTIKRASSSRTLGAAGIDPIDVAGTTISLGTTALDATLKPLAWTRSDEPHGPGGLDLAAPVVNVVADSAAVATIDPWSASAVSGFITYKQLTAVYKTPAGRTLTVRLDTFPARWEPYPIAGRRALELAAGATALEVS